MYLEFICKQNIEDPYINGAVFRLKDGSIVRIDRERTGYDMEDGILNMGWSGLYIWDGENADYDIPEDFLEGASLIEMEVEDDAPEGYEFECIICAVDGKRIPVIKGVDLIGFVYRHGRNDFEFWQHDLPPYVIKSIETLLEPYTNTGCSIRGSATDIGNELKEI